MATQPASNSDILPPVFMVWVSAYWQLLLCGLFLGLPLAVFSVGVGFVSGWHAPKRQGTALGIYGAGNVGQSIALFGAPLLVGAVGYRWGFWTFSLMTAAWLILMIAFARNAPRRGSAKSLADFTRPLGEPMRWVLSLYYFLTFGGFLAMASYLPKFLTLSFHLSAGLGNPAERSSLNRVRVMLFAIKTSLMTHHH
jgi:NNP family nitrate/nitrite transporter-like MFS transporter